MKPVKTENDELMPRETPAKLGLMSTTDARAPLETAPWSIKDTVRRATAKITWHPEYANPITHKPFTIKPTKKSRYDRDNKSFKFHSHSWTLRACERLFLTFCWSWEDGRKQLTRIARKWHATDAEVPTEFLSFQCPIHVPAGNSLELVRWGWTIPKLRPTVQQCLATWRAM